jgi:hypothetical protein
MFICIYSLSNFDTYTQMQKYCCKISRIKLKEEGRYENIVRCL